MQYGTKNIFANSIKAVGCPNVFDTRLAEALLFTRDILFDVERSSCEFNEPAALLTIICEICIFSHNLVFLLESDVLDVEVDLCPVLDGDGVEAELLELLDLPVRRVHVPVQVQPVLRREDRI